MKKQLLNVCVAFAATMLFAGSVLAQHEAPVRAESVSATKGVMIIDGTADEESWGAESAITEMFNAAGVTSATDFSGYIKLTWDKTNLYLFANITDDIATNFPGTGDVYTFDCVEIFQDLDTLSPTPATGAYISGDGADQMQHRFNRGVDTACGTAPRNGVEFEFIQAEAGAGWTLEVALPWVAFMPVGSVPEDINDWVAKALGFDCQIADNDGAGRDGQAMWDADVAGEGATEDNAWRDTRTFGVITLTGTPFSAVKPVENSVFGVYPNPATSEVNFTNLDGVTSIELVNLIGQIVKTVSVSAPELSLNVSDVAAGNYIVKIISNNGISTEQLIIK